MFGFKKKEVQEQEIDYKSLNELIRTSKKIVDLLLILGIVSLVVLGNGLLLNWGIFKIIFTLLKVISPLFIGFIIAWLLTPAVNFMVRKKFNRTFSIVVVFFLFLVIIALLFWLLIPGIAGQLQDAIGMIPSLLENITNWINNLFEDLTNIYNYDFSSVRNSIFETIKTFTENVTVTLPQKLINIGTKFLSGSITVLLSLCIGFYMMFDFQNIRKNILKVLPNKWHNNIIELTNKLNESLKSYVLGTLFVTFILFIFQTIGFTIAGLKAPAIFGLVCAITNIIPYIGPYLGGIPAVLVGFTISPIVGLFTLIAVVTSQLLESYVLTPIVLSKTMKLKPVTIIIGLLIFEHFFGIIGMLFSTPVISCLKLIVEYINEKLKLKEKINNQSA